MQRTFSARLPRDLAPRASRSSLRVVPSLGAGDRQRKRRVHGQGREDEVAGGPALSSGGGGQVPHQTVRQGRQAGASTPRRPVFHHCQFAMPPAGASSIDRCRLLAASNFCIHGHGVYIHVPRLLLCTTMPLQCLITKKVYGLHDKKYFKNTFIKKTSETKKLLLDHQEGIHGLHRCTIRNTKKDGALRLACICFSSYLSIS